MTAPPSTPPWLDAPPEHLLEALRQAGLEVPAGLPEAIVRRADEMRDLLCAFITDPAHWAEEDAQRTWAPIHALFLLGAIGDARAAPALVWVLRNEELDDWLTEGMPEVLAALDPGALDALAELARDTRLDALQRNAATRGMYGMGVRHTAVRPQVTQILTELAQLRGDPGFTAVLVDDVVRTGDPRGYAALEAAFDQDAVDLMYIHRGLLAELRDAAPPWTWPDELRAPMEHFSAARLEQLRRVQRDDLAYAAKEAQRARMADFGLPGDDSQTVRREGPKVGRNDPCPCGSGKKYKKCCLGGATPTPA